MKQRAFMTLDAIMAMAIIAIATTLFVVTLTRMRRASDTFADQRAAARATTEVLLSLQQAGPPPAIDASRFTIQPLDTAAPDGWRWVSVRCDMGRAHSEIVGLARRQP